MRALAVAALLIAGRVGAQCCGDCDGSGEITLGEVQGAFNQFLSSECSIDDGCPTHFGNQAGRCVFEGRWNDDCGGDNLIVAVRPGEFSQPIDFEIDTNPAAFLTAVPARDRLATVVRFLNGAGAVGNLPGVAELSLDGARLQIWIANEENTFRIDGCRFVHFDGAFRSVE